MHAIHRYEQARLARKQLADALNRRRAVVAFLHGEHKMASLANKAITERKLKTEAAQLARQIWGTPRVIRVDQVNELLAKAAHVADLLAGEETAYGGPTVASSVASLASRGGSTSTSTTSSASASPRGTARLVTKAITAPASFRASSVSSSPSASSSSSPLSTASMSTLSLPSTPAPVPVSAPASVSAPAPVPEYTVAAAPTPEYVSPDPYYAPDAAAVSASPAASESTSWDSGASSFTPSVTALPTPYPLTPAVSEEKKGWSNKHIAAAVGVTVFAAGVLWYVSRRKS